MKNHLVALLLLATIGCSAAPKADRSQCRTLVGEAGAAYDAWMKDMKPEILDRAIACLDRAIAADPTVADPYFMRAMFRTYPAMKQPELKKQILADLDTCLACAPENRIKDDVFTDAKTLRAVLTKE